MTEKLQYFICPECKSIEHQEIDLSNNIEINHRCKNCGKQFSVKIAFGYEKKVKDVARDDNRLAKIPPK